MELELVDAARVALDVGGDRVGGLLVVLGLDQVQQFAGPGQAFVELADAGDVLVQQRPFAAQRLGARRIVPDVRVFQFPVDFLEPLYLGVVVKDTPSTHPAGHGGRRCAGGWD